MKGIFKKSQPVLDKLPLVVQHRDANPSNWRIVTVNDNTYLNIIDLETLGPARRGWDEGRMYSLLCLSADKQEIFLETMQESPDFQSKESQIYFWRVVFLDHYEN